MKRKTNISVQDNKGIRISPNMIVGETFNGYKSGDILDANAIIDLVKSMIDAAGGDVSKIVTSKDILDGTIMLNDLADEVTDKLESEYDQDDEILYMNGSRSNN